MEELERKMFRVDFGFTKSATPTGDLELKGYASTWVEDRDSEVVARDAFSGTLDPYLKGNPILLWQHDQSKPIGSVRDARVDDNGLSVKAYIPKPDSSEPDWAHLAYHKVKKGVVRTFSIGGVFHKQVQRGKRLIKSVDLMEISVVSVPSNPRSIFECAVKSFDGPLRPELSTEAIGQMKMLIGMEGISDPELATMDDGELRERYVELAGLYRDAGRVPPGLDEWRPISARVREAGAKGAPDVFEAAAGAVEMVKRVRGEVSPVDSLDDATVERLVETSNLLAGFLERLAEKRFNPRQPRDSHGRWRDMPGGGDGVGGIGRSNTERPYSNLSDPYGTPVSERVSNLPDMSGPEAVRWKNNIDQLRRRTLDPRQKEIYSKWQERADEVNRSASKGKFIAAVVDLEREYVNAKARPDEPDFAALNAIYGSLIGALDSTQ